MRRTSNATTRVRKNGASRGRSLRDTRTRALLACAFLIALSAASVGGAATLEGDGFSLEYPDAEWVQVPSPFRATFELIAAEAPVADGAPAARIMVAVERRLSHEGALRRLREIDAERSTPATFLLVGGWPALQRRYMVPVDRPGVGSEVADEAEISTRVTTAVAARSLLLRVEASLVPGADPIWADRAEQIGRNLRFDASGEPGAIEVELESLREGPRLVPERSPDAPSSTSRLRSQVRSSVGDSAGVPQRVQAGLGVDSEIEIAVSNDGQTVVVANNSRDFATSTDGGQTFVTTGVAPSPPGGGANGDPSLAFGATGNFYFAYIGFPAAGQCSTGVTWSTNSGVSFNFVANATVCDNAGVAGPSCFPDQEHIAADRTNLSASGQDQVYSTWRNFSGGGCGPAGSPTAIAGPEVPTIVCSSNSGATWGPSVLVGNMGDAYPRIAVGQDGFVYVVYRAGNNIMLNKFSSCDNGLNSVGGFPVTIAAGISRVTCPVPGLDRCNNGSDLSSHTVAVDDTNPNHIYAAYAVNTSAGVNENVILRDSTDGGMTWPGARSVQLNAATSGRRFMPWVCATGGTAYVTWYDMRAATAMQNDVTDYFAASGALDNGGNLTAGAEFQISTVSDNLCASGWPAAPRAQGDSESCAAPLQPQLAGSCTDNVGNPTGVRCDFSDCGGAGNGAGASCQCNVGASETCNLGRGVPKYGDYSGNACAAGQLFAAWASATSPAGVLPPSTSIDVFFDTPLNDPPVADAGPDQILECVGGGGSTTLDGTGSTDPDGDALTYTWTDGFIEGGGTVTGPTPMVTFPSLGDFLVLLEVEDPVGFSDTDSVEITVEDTTPPSLTAPPDVTAECAAPGGTAVALGSPVVSDGCDDSVTVTNDAPALFPLGSTVVTYRAEDDSGNFTEDTQVVTIEDTTPPTLTAAVLPLSTEEDPLFRVVLSCEDICDAAPTLGATFNGIPVPDGQVLELEYDDELDFRDEGGVLRIEAPRFELLAECRDESGNESSASVIPPLSE